jgi:hypothetical protein
VTDSCIDGGSRRVPGKNHWPAASHWQTLPHNIVSSTPRHEQVFEHITLLVRATACTCSYKSNYHTVTTTKAHQIMHRVRIEVMVFNGISNNVSVISWRSALVEEARVPGDKPPTCRKSLTNFITQYCIKHTSQWVWFELTALVVIDTDCMYTCSCNSNYHTILIAEINKSIVTTSIVKVGIPVIGIFF